MAFDLSDEGKRKADQLALFSELTFSEVDIQLDEGLFHKGIASVIRVTGVK